NTATSSTHTPAPTHANPRRVRPVLPTTPYYRFVTSRMQTNHHRPGFSAPRPVPSPMPRIASVQLKVGLEVHVELATRTKMFSRAPSPAHPEFALSPPNTLLDPTVLALPGSLP